MPEYPDVELYVTRLRERLLGETLQRLLFFSAFVLRSTEVPPKELEGRPVEDVFRLGKRIVLGLSDERFVVIHLMIAGRLSWVSPSPPLKPAMGKVMIAALRFSSGQLNLVEQSTKKRASIHLVAGRDGLEAHRRSGLDVFSANAEQFSQRLRSENRTLKRMLTNPHVLEGIGNAYSDEILFAARLSPLRRTGSLSDEEMARLHTACVETLATWRERLHERYKGFPKPAEITAFRPDFATHGKFGKPCPVCGAPIQRIVYAENETNYCAACQNEGRVLADRSLSRLLKDDWPKTLEEMLEDPALAQRGVKTSGS